MDKLNLKLFFIRKAKALFMLFRLHLIFEPFFSFLLNLAYMAKLSKWRAENGPFSFDDFYNSNVKYEDRFKLHQHVFEKENLTEAINYLEFGVADGVSFKWWADKNKNPDSRFFGFDTFTGLPEDFGVMKKNDYDTRGNFPDVNDERCSFYAGLFQKSLPRFLENFKFDKRTVLHLDADLYSSTLFVFTTLYPNLKKGDIIIFDEFGVPTHEFKAFIDITSAFPLKYRYLGAINNYLQVAIIIE